MIVKGQGIVKEKEEEEGMKKILIEEGLEWREKG